MSQPQICLAKTPTQPLILDESDYELPPEWSLDDEETLGEAAIRIHGKKLAALQKAAKSVDGSPIAACSTKR